MPSTAATTVDSLSLCALQMAHAAAMYRWMLDPEVSRNIGLRTEPTLQKTEEWIKRASTSREFFPLAIHWNGRHIGNVIFDQIAPDGSLARLSTYLGEPDARNQGLGTQALRASIEKAFDERGLQNIWLHVHSDNQRARRVYEKLGFRGDPDRMVLRREDWRLQA